MSAEFYESRPGKIDYPEGKKNIHNIRNKRWSYCISQLLRISSLINELDHQPFLGRYCNILRVCSTVYAITKTDDSNHQCNRQNRCGSFTLKKTKTEVFVLLAFKRNDNQVLLSGV